MARVARHISDLLLPHQVTYITLTPAQILLLNTTPITIVNSEPGYAVIPDKVQAFKEAGTAYTLGGATGLQFRSVDGVGTLLGQLTLAGFLDQAAAKSSILLAPSSATVTLPTLTDYSTSVGSSLVAFMAGANVTVGTCNVKLVIFYYLFPLNFSQVG